jgi:subtilisin family serine protease
MRPPTAPRDGGWTLPGRHEGALIVKPFVLVWQGIAALFLLMGNSLPDVPSRPVVAVIDSGVARTPELEGLLVAEYDVAAPSPRQAFVPRYDHGTMVATILARAAKNQVEIVSIRIDDPAGCPAGANPPCQPSAKVVERAIRQATRLGVDAINLSLSLAEDKGIVDAVRDAAAKGITIVIAAGNEGRDHPANLRMAEAAYPHAVLVGALDAGGQPWAMTNKPDANPEGYLYTWQRGVDVPTMLANGRAAFATGTSFAAPIETARLIVQSLPRTAAPVVMASESRP